MIIEIILMILVYFIGLGGVAAIAEVIMEDPLWIEDPLDILFLIFYPIAVPIWFLFSIGRYIVYIIAYFFSKEKKD